LLIAKTSLFNQLKKPVMRKLSVAAVFLLGMVALTLSDCNQGNSNESSNTSDSTMMKEMAYGGFESQVKWGAHLVTLGGCNDCHTPKKMGPNGPEDDSSLLLSGSPAQQPPPAFDLKEAAKKGLIITQSFTSWMGPWGITYAANLTSDSTGIGNWTEAQFVKSVHEKKWMGLDNTRPLMPPMSMMPATQMTVDELKAIFAYLKTTAPIKNVPPTAVLLPPPGKH
jgi:Cytochrome c